MIHILNFIVRCIFLPSILLLILTIFIPGAIQDVKQWRAELFPKKAKRKTVYVSAAATAKYSNSFSYSQAH